MLCLSLSSSLSSIPSTTSSRCLDTSLLPLPHAVLLMASPKSKSHHRPKQQQRGIRRPLLLRRAMLHSCLCFLLGLLTGLAPSEYWTNGAAATAQVFRSAIGSRNQLSTTTTSSSQHHLLHHHQKQELVVVVTTTGQSERERRSAGLTRTAHALRLVSPPVVWLVVEAAQDAVDTALLLRRTGVVYRHVTYNDNFSRSAEEMERHHQRSLALAHIEQHRMRGVVLFAGLGEVYDIRLLDQLRRIRTLGAWLVATVWEQRVAVEGPVCSGPAAAVVTGWLSSHDGEVVVTEEAAGAGPRLRDVDVHGFAFSSDLLLDPARWDRFPTDEADQSQDSVKFVQRLLVEDYSKTRAMPDDGNCSEIMAWRVDTALL